MLQKVAQLQRRKCVQVHTQELGEFNKSQDKTIANETKSLFFLGKRRQLNYGWRYLVGNGFVARLLCNGVRVIDGRHWQLSAQAFDDLQQAGQTKSLTA